ncbi:MAG: hypothetical protein AMXMBFR53_08160 [Gemmatimonadota bacterium]
MTTTGQAAFVAAVSFALGLAPAGAQQRAETLFSREAFASLAWLEGRWVGSGGGFDAYYEEYRALNDSTWEQRTFPDSTFSTPDGTSTIEWRGGVILKRRGGTVETRVARIAGDTARFEPVVAGRRGFTWFRVSRDEWRAVLDRPTEPVVYTLKRFRR